MKVSKMRKFKEINIGEKFIFKDFVEKYNQIFSGMFRGKFVKISPRKYKHTDRETNFKIRSINTFVDLLKGE
jgi:hypothetical protein